MADGSTSFSSPSTIVSFSMAPRGRKPDSTAIDGRTSGGDHIHYRGVRKQRWGRRYGAEITDPSKKTRVWLGSFNTAEEAARAYDEAARSFHGDKAKTNFPLPTERRTTKSSQIAESSTVNQSSNNNSGGVPITILDTSLPYLRGFPMAHSQIDYLNLVELHGSYAPPPPNSTTAAVNCGPTNSDSSSVVNLSQPSSDRPQSGKAVTLEIDLNYPPSQVP